MRVAILAVVGSLCTFPWPVVAAPAELLNKTITVSYAVTIPTRMDDGRVVSGSRNASRTIYISSAGRTFARASRSDGRRGETRDAAPGEAGNTYRWQGSRLVGVMSFVSGAVQMIITFGPGGQSCDASIVIGRDGSNTLKRRGVDGSIREAAGPATVSGVSCSILAGNAFAEG